MITIQTDHFVNKIITNCFAQGTKSKIINIKDYNFNIEDKIATYGILRGTGEILKKANKFIYLDHGYISSSDRLFKNGGTQIKDLNGYFRIVKNDFVGFEIKKYNEDRLLDLKLQFTPKRKHGEYIILSEPSQYMKDFYNIDNWVDNTIEELKKHTDRKIFVHNKFSKIPLDALLTKAWAFVSFQSSAGFKSMIKGIPAHFTHDKLKKINSLENIENGEIGYDVFKSLAYNQWNLDEIKNGLMNKEYNF